MAIEKMITASNGVPLTYHRVASVMSYKGIQTTIEVVSYISAETRSKEVDAYESGNAEDVYTDATFVNIPYQPNFTIDDAYDYIKQLPKFSDAKNLLNADDSPLAWASAVAGGEVGIDEVPDEIKTDVEKVNVAEKPADKEGFVCKRKVVPTEWSVVWELEEDPNYHPYQPDGSYLKPYQFEPGMTVEESMWYTDGDDIWECIEAGVADAFAAPWFDVIEV